MSKPASRWLTICLWVVVTACSFYNLSNFPTLWWDEGIFSETAANLAQHGRYAMTIQSPDQLQDFDNRISAGPVVILPVALTYRLLGVGVLPGRLVAASFLVLTLIFLYLCARQLVGQIPAFLAVALALAATDISGWGRSVMGDIPALGCFLAASFLILRGLQQDRLLYFLMGGFCLGLAGAAKEFYVLACLPPALVLGLSYWGKFGRLGKAWLALILGVSVPLLAYVLIKGLILGSMMASIWHFIHQKKLLCHEFFTPFTIGRVYPESFAYLLTHPIMITGILGLGWYGKKNRCSLSLLYWVINLGCWSIFYLLAVYWQRFALPALILACPFAGYFVVQVTSGLWSFARLPQLPAWSKVAGAIALVALLYPWPLTGCLIPLLTRTTDSPYRVVNYLHDYIPTGFLIETPEYELTFLDDEHRFHLMPEYYFLESTSEEIKLLNPRDRAYDFSQVGAEILILGSFGKSVFQQIYPPVRVNKKYKKIATIDYYDVYLLKDKALPMQVRVKDTASFKLLPLAKD
jgi:4-amino-4-deoxy-L-arabinose transferase-like glycosyltransferase